MLKIAVVLFGVIALASCDMINTVKDGLKHTRATAARLEASTGVRPEVGFNWKDGRLTAVTVLFPRLYEKKGLRELAAIVRRSVSSEFRQKPDDIVLSFSLGPSDGGNVAMAQPAR